MTTPPFSSLQELFADERRWCQGTSYCTRNDGIRAYCLRGGIMAVYADGAMNVHVHNILTALVGGEAGPPTTLAVYNDACIRTIADIQALVKLANV